MVYRKAQLALILAAATAAPALAQTNISPSHSYSWLENCGWMNWREAGWPAGSQGAVIHRSFMEGMVWIENVGWLNLGDGTPGASKTVPAYSNLSGDDAGVNVRDSGDLDGFAWGENIGWISFSTAAALGEARARFDRASGRLRGYAWAENAGWLNLDDAVNYVATACYADCDGNEFLNVADYMCFMNRYAAGDPYANCDSSTAPPVLNVADFVCYMNRYAAGCP